MQTESAHSHKKRIDATAVYPERIDVVLICLLVISSVFVLIGLGAYFRNEDARLLVWLKNNRDLFDAFDLSIRYFPTTARPVYEFILRAIYNLYGNNPLAYQVVSGCFFIGAILFYYKIAQLLFHKSAGLFIIVVLYLTFFHTFHFLHTPIQGLQYPVELLLVSGAVFFMIKGINKGSFINFYFPLNVLWTVLAIFTHPVSALLLPLLCTTLIIINWSSFEQGNTFRKLSGIALYLLFILLIPVVTEQVTVADSSVVELIMFLYTQYVSYANIFLRNDINVIILSLPLFYGLISFIISKYLFHSKNSNSVFVYSVPIAIIGMLIVYNLPENISFIILSIVLIATAFLDKGRFFLVVWFYSGFLPNLMSNVITATYIRHSAFALSFIIGIGWWEIIANISTLIEKKYKKIVAVFSLERAAVLLTVFIVFAVFVTKYNIFYIPFVDKQIKQIDYIKDMGNNFRDVVFFLSDRADKNDNIYFVPDPSRDTERKYLYTNKRLVRLTPARWKYYSYYFRAYNRNDLKVDSVYSLVQEPIDINDKIIILVATNNWEANYLESQFPLEVWKVIKRGSAVAKIYKMKTIARS